MRFVFDDQEAHEKWNLYSLSNLKARLSRAKYFQNKKAAFIVA